MLLGPGQQVEANRRQERPCTRARALVWMAAAAEAAEAAARAIDAVAVSDDDVDRWLCGTAPGTGAPPFLACFVRRGWGGGGQGR